MNSIKTKFTTILVILLIASTMLLSLSQVLVFELQKMKQDTHLSIELSMREQSRRMLNSARDLIIQEINEAVKVKGINVINDNDFIREITKKYVAPLQIAGPTGDAFLIRIRPDEKFLYDGSPDCAKPEFLINGRYMLDEVIVQRAAFEILEGNNIDLHTEKLTMRHINLLKRSYPNVYQEMIDERIILHQVPEQAEKTLNKMRFAKDTMINDRNYWQFDDSKELLEWVVIPEGLENFEGNINGYDGLEVDNGTKWLLALGIQSDELYKQYEQVDRQYDKILLLIHFILVIVIVLIISSCVYIILVLKEKGNKLVDVAKEMESDILGL